MKTRRVGMKRSSNKLWLSHDIRKTQNDTDCEGSGATKRQLNSFTSENDIPFFLFFNHRCASSMSCWPMYYSHGDIDILLNLLISRKRALVGCTQTLWFLLGQLFREVPLKFLSFSYAIVTTSAYRDGDSCVIFLSLCLISFIFERMRRKWFHDINNFSGIFFYPVVESRRLARLRIFCRGVGAVCRLHPRRKSTVDGSEVLLFGTKLWGCSWDWGYFNSQNKFRITSVISFFINTFHWLYDPMFSFWLYKINSNFTSSLPG